ncbi:hypothetical protein CDAR_271811 [Caerostris darwini]|uniref:Uncharacterized protein n=1 Tax=Caerostris darwini TaxID=1538125 RepID=A0AAV4T102_9ARAC|nr:hypothetical protein CDAR_271811 [Caerostris darwini]
MTYYEIGNSPLSVSLQIDLSLKLEDSVATRLDKALVLPDPLTMTERWCVSCPEGSYTKFALTTLLFIWCEETPREKIDDSPTFERNSIKEGKKKIYPRMLSCFPKTIAQSSIYFDDTLSSSFE